MNKQYHIHYFYGLTDKKEGKECNLPNTIPDINAFNGYIDGYCGHPPQPPKDTVLLIDRLQAEGMTFISDNLLKKEGQ
jgi:hypothetical protein|tara:strand:- start:866 stop:1099 length:234 start_codon:yes stop_codon:yes gene_type:complete